MVGKVKEKGRDTFSTATVNRFEMTTTLYGDEGKKMQKVDHDREGVR
jgi:hypothetical protein